jgi:hypothetical protein
MISRLQAGRAEDKAAIRTLRTELIKAYMLIEQLKNKEPTT